MRWSQDDLDAYERRVASNALAAARQRPVLDDRGLVGMEVAAGQEKRAAGLKFRSKAEARYADLLEARKRAGEIESWGFEDITLVVGQAIDMTSRITPDFTVRRHDGRLELHEVKGWLRDDARAKLLGAVKQWPQFAWVLVWSKRSGFEFQALN